MKYIHIFIVAFLATMSVSYAQAETQNKNLIVLIHGWGGNIDSFERVPTRLTESLGSNIEVVVLELPCHGSSVCPMLREDMMVEDFRDEILKKFDGIVLGFKPENTTVYGTSFGAQMAGLISAKRKVGRLILHAPALYPDNWDGKPLSVTKMIENPVNHKKLVSWRNKKRRATESLLLMSLSQFTGELHLVESQKDEIVPGTVIDSCVDASASPRTIRLPSAQHSLSEEETYNVLLRVLAPKVGELGGGKK